MDTHMTLSEQTSKRIPARQQAATISSALAGSLAKLDGQLARARAEMARLDVEKARLAKIVLEERATALVETAGADGANFARLPEKNRLTELIVKSLDGDPARFAAALRKAANVAPVEELADDAPRCNRCSRPLRKAGQDCLFCHPRHLPNALACPTCDTAMIKKAGRSRCPSCGEVLVG